MTDSPAESKTQLLRQLYKDVVQLKKDLEPLQQTSAWIKSNFRQTLDSLRESLAAEISQLQQDLTKEMEYSKGITLWIKENIGTKLEKVKEIVDKSFASHVEKQLEDTKAREESLWTIFNAKIEHINERIESVLAKAEEEKAKMDSHFETQQKWIEQLLASQVQKMEAQYSADKQKLESQLAVVTEELKKAHTARVKMEQSYAVLQETYEKALRDIKERPEAEIAMFRKLVKKLEEERKKMEEETKKMEEERKKMEEERKKFNALVKDERNRFQERQMLQLEREKLEEERQRIIRERQLSAAAAVASMPLAVTTDTFVARTAAPGATLVSHASPVPVTIPTRSSVAQGSGSQSESLSSSSESLPESEVTNWLKSIGFASYAAKFHQYGYDSLQLVALLDEDDLNILEITLPGHRKGLLAAANKLRAVEYGTSASFGIPQQPPQQQSPAPTLDQVSPVKGRPLPPRPQSNSTTVSLNNKSNTNADRPLPKPSGAIEQ